MVLIFASFVPSSSSQPGKRHLDFPVFVGETCFVDYEHCVDYLGERLYYVEMSKTFMKIILWVKGVPWEFLPVKCKLCIQQFELYTKCLSPLYRYYFWFHERNRISLSLSDRQRYLRHFAETAALKLCNVKTSSYFLSTSVDISYFNNNLRTVWLFFFPEFIDMLLKMQNGGIMIIINWSKIRAYVK